MRYEWEVQDVVCGRLVDANNRSERYVIGYDPSCGSERRYALISLADGQISDKELSKHDLAARLNQVSMRPVQIVRPDFSGNKEKP